MTTTTELITVEVREGDIAEAEDQLQGWRTKVRDLRAAGASRREIRLAEGAVNTWDERLYELTHKKEKI